jgi:hypothetical protein
MQIRTLGIDLGKTFFHLVGHNAGGEVVMRKKFSRQQLLRFTANLTGGMDWHGGLRGARFLRRILGGLSLDRTGWMVSPSILSPYPRAPARRFASWLRPLFRKDWIVYSQPPFGGSEYVLHYLGRYTLRVAIFNRRLVSSQVTFRCPTPIKSALLSPAALSETPAIFVACR